MKIKKLILTENTKFRYNIEDITEETTFDNIMAKRFALVV
jgi:hypothetical protein